jgi:EAL domain-containing protein (putative c-di-GMP-specific phosphodiesterase class I)
VRQTFFDRLDLRADLMRGFAAGEFFLAFQPIVSLATGAVIGTEALLRWDHPRRGVLTPDAFMATAEDSGVIVQIGGWALDTALEQLVRWRRRGLKVEFFVSVNVSARQLLAEDFAEKVRSSMASSSIEPQWIHLELTESALIEDSTPSVQLLEATRQLGVELIVDDFGKGYSARAYPKPLPVSALKIDREFIVGLEADEHDSLIVDAVVSLAHALHLGVIAEGVESVGQARRLKDLGCESAQGFIWSEPLGPDEFEAWLAAYHPRSIEELDPQPARGWRPGGRGA